MALRWLARHRADLAQPNLPRTRYRIAIPRGTADGLAWEVTVQRDGVPADLTGWQITAEIRRPDGASVLVSGSSDGPVATAVLPADCAAVPGRIDGILWAARGADEKIALAAASWTVTPAGDADSVIDPEGIVPDLPALLSEAAALHALNESVRTAEDSRVQAELARESAEIQRRAALDDTQVSRDTHWSSQYTVERLCAPFSASGTEIICHPVAGSRLTVLLSGNDPATLLQTGKNLADPAVIAPQTYIKEDDSVNTRNGILLPGGATYACSGSPSATGNAEYIYAYILDAQQRVQGKLNYLVTGLTGKHSIVTVPEGCVLLIFDSLTAHTVEQSVAAFRSTCAQVERGSTATGYLPYTGSTYPLTPGVPAEIIAVEGLNHLTCGTGSITVTGWEDPRYTMQTLKSAILSLGGNI